MFEVSHVVVCADGSAGSLTALDHARLHCTGPEPRIRLVRALPDLPESMRSILFPFAAMGSDESTLRAEFLALEREAVIRQYAVPTEALETPPSSTSSPYAQPQEDPDADFDEDSEDEPDDSNSPSPHTYTVHCLATPPQSSITETLHQSLSELGPEMIFAGTSGQSGLRVGMLGTVSETLASTAPCPVFLARSGERARPVRNILAALDLSPSSPAVYRAALALALRFGANLHVWTVLPSPTSQDIAGALSSHLKYDGRSLKQRARRDLRKRISNLREETEVPFPWREARDNALREHVQIEFGDPITKLLNAVDSADVDLVVLGRQGLRKAPIAQRIGRTARALLTTLSCHTLVIPPPSSNLSFS